MKLAALQQNPQQEYRQRKLDLIGKAFSFILSGISWLSVNLTELKLIAYTLGLLFLGIAIYVISATYKATWFSSAERFIRKVQPLLWPIVVISVLLALSRALPLTQHDWRFLTLGIIVLFFIVLTIISLCIIIAKRLKHKEYNWVDFVAILIIIIASIAAYSNAQLLLSGINIAMQFILQSLLTVTGLLLNFIKEYGALLAFLVSFAALIYTIISGRRQAKNLSNQTELLRKQVFGQLYDVAQVAELSFIIPAEWKHKIKGFRQNEVELNIGTYIAIPIGQETELNIRWRWAENHSMIGYNVGFKESNPYAPDLLRKLRVFQKQSFQEFTREEYIDYHGWFHTEYAHLRRVAKDDFFVTTIEVRGKVKGKYTLSLEIKVHEAPNYLGDLVVECLDSPNGWAEEHWDNEFLRLKPVVKSSNTSRTKRH
jgi:hypothetical protein